MLSRFYDIEYAQKLLLEAEIDRHDKTKNARQLAYCNVNDFTVVQFSQPKSWRLVWSPNNSTEVEEHALRLRGVICGKMLPPVGKSSARKRDRHHLSQTVVVTGFGGELFGSAIDSVLRIHSKFSREFEEGQLKDIELEKYQSYLAIKAHTRYFTPAKMATEQESIPFDPLTDPEQSLKSLVDDEYIHIADNQVEYGRIIATANGKSAVERVSPRIFKNGDIVEITVAFVAYPAKDHCVKLVPVLRGIMMLNASATEDAVIRETYMHVVRPQNRLAITRVAKRDIFDDDDQTEGVGNLEDGEVEEEHARNKFARMHIDEDVSDAIRRGFEEEVA